MFCTTKKVSIIVIFHNMRREAPRTLLSLTTSYQLDTTTNQYEVIVIDSNSTAPLDKSWVLSLGSNFRYYKFSSPYPSPCQALNFAIKHAKHKYVMCCIDGARILSPAIISLTRQALELHKHPFIYTLGMHLGPQPQNILIEKGYNKQDEDLLLSTIDWKNNGYQLFDISSVALSSKLGFYSKLSESNCFTTKKKDLLSMGGFNEKFTSPGGGLANLEIFNHFMNTQKYQPIMLLGEATFHQIHGGVATNVPMNKHPFNKMLREYKNIFGNDYTSIYRSPLYFGRIHLKHHKNII